MPDLTGPELDAWLAENVCRWELGAPFGWRPHSCRDDLAEVLAKVPEEKRDAIIFKMCFDLLPMSDDDPEATNWRFLTAPPETICRAIYAAMKGDGDE